MLYATKQEGYYTTVVEKIDPDYQGMFGLLLHSSSGKTTKVRAFSGEF